METLGPQICFVDEFDFMHCNLKRINGVLTATKSGKWWTWKQTTPLRKRKKQKEADPEKKSL